MTQQEINIQSMLRVGTILRGIYRIENYLSSGGFGNTYVATNVEFDERVAIKEFFMKGVTQRDNNQTSISVSNVENTSSFLEQKEKFKKEARRLRRLKNEHIVKVHDIFEENGTAYYVMDYIDGMNLAERLKQTGRPMTESELRLILPQILDALKTVHEDDFCHLDIKPSNIMLEKGGIIKLIDFGASKQLGVSGTLTTNAPTAFAQTPGYAPREQTEQNLDKIGPWTDIYALGATLYNLLTNRKPPLPLDIDDDISEDKHVALPFTAEVSNEMKKLVLKMMKTNRRQRPQNVNGLIDKLDTIIEPKLESESDSEETLLGGEVEPSEKDELRLYKKEAQEGNGLACLKLAKAYLYGDKVAKDVGEAIKWYSKAGGDISGKDLCNIGHAYMIGDTVPVNKSKAVEFYIQAAVKGNPIAQYNMGLCYEKGDGLPRDINDAKYWYEKAASQSHAQAQQRLTSIQILRKIQEENKRNNTIAILISILFVLVFIAFIAYAVYR